MKKVGMTGIIHQPSISERFHNGGYTLVIKDIIEKNLNCKIDILDENSDWGMYEIIIFSEGSNYNPGVWNVFGGVNERIINKLKKLNEYSGKVFSIDQSIDYQDFIKKRKELKEMSFLNIQKIFPIKMDSITEKLILGDSHSLSVYRPGYCISKNDGKTLHGFLKQKIQSYIPEKTKELVFYSGNIDIRFHIHNNGGLDAIRSLLVELESQLNGLLLDKISLVSMLPIEDESRIIPGTGKYKGKSFFGSREERQYYVDYMNSLLKNMCMRNNWEFLEWNLGSQLDFNKMEQKQSVHLRPSSYMFYKEIN